MRQRLESLLYVLIFVFLLIYFFLTLNFSSQNHALHHLRVVQVPQAGYLMDTRNPRTELLTEKFASTTMEIVVTKLFILISLTVQECLFMVL